MADFLLEEKWQQNLDRYPGLKDTSSLQCLDPTLITSRGNAYDYHHICHYLDNISHRE